MKKETPQLDNVYLGDCMQILKSWPEEFIDVCMTSPPYWALRDFGADAETVWGGHENCMHEWALKEIQTGQTHWNQGGNIIPYKERKIRDGHKRHLGFCTKCGAWKGQLGLEPTFDLFIKHLCDIFDEIKRVLKPGGTCWVNMGDTYGGSMQGYGATKNSKTGFQKAPKNTGYYASSKNKPPMANMMQKCLLQVPNRFAIEMCNRGWILRNEIIWHKPNSMPTSAKDRFTVDFEKIFLFTKNRKYYFETQYEPHLSSANRPPGVVRNREYAYQGKYKIKRDYKKEREIRKKQGVSGTHPVATGFDHNLWNNPLGRNKRTVWRITTRPFPEAHFAVYPEELCVTPIKAGCPEFICKKCGKPRKKIYKGRSENAFNIRDCDAKKGRFKEKWGSTQRISSRYEEYEGDKQYAGTGKKLEGYSDCGCNAGFKTGIVFDPFMGSGTTAVVAKKLGRRFLGTEANPEYKEIAKRRLNNSIGKKDKSKTNPAGKLSVSNGARGKE